MTEKKILITGSEGIVGKILTGHTLAAGVRPALRGLITRVDANPQRGSGESNVLDKRGTSYNLPELTDTTNTFVQSSLKSPAEIERLLAEHDVVMHAAWGGSGIVDPTSYNPENLRLVHRILDAAVRLGKEKAPTIVLFSSVNAHVPEDWMERQQAGKLIGVDEVPEPLHHNRGGKPGPGFTKYGQDKVKMEDLATGYAFDKGLDIVIPRLGGVNLYDQPSSANPFHQELAHNVERGAHFDVRWEEAVRLSHEDLVDKMQSVVDRPHMIGHFEIFNLVSNVPGRVHEL